MDSSPVSVRIVEVGPRDGLQNIREYIPTTLKLELIDRLTKCGLRTVEMTSIVSPSAVPQLADSQQLLSSSKVSQLLRKPDIRLPVLVPNLKGFNIARQYGVQEVAVFVSATDGFSRRNTNCSPEQGIARAKEVARAARDVGLALRG